MAMRLFGPSDFAAELLKHGYKKYSSKGKYEVWVNERNNVSVVIPKSKTIPDYYLDIALKKIGKLYIDPNEK